MIAPDKNPANHLIGTYMILGPMKSMDPTQETSKGPMPPRPSEIAPIVAQIDRVISEHVAEIESRRKTLADLRKAREVLVRSTGLGEAVAADVRVSSRKRPRKNSLNRTVRDNAYTIIKRLGRPLSRSELLAQMTDMGISVEGTKPAKSVGKIMWAAEEFIHVKDGYWIKDLPLPDPAD